MKKLVKSELVNMIETYNAQRFIVGMNLGLDHFAAESILSFREKYPNITLECAIPHENQAIYWREEQRNRYYSILEHCDKESLLQFQYTPNCMFKRNEYMVRQSDFLLSVWDGGRGIVKRTISLARSRHLHIITIDPHTYEVTPHLYIII